MRDNLRRARNFVLDRLPEKADPVDAFMPLFHAIYTYNGVKRGMLKLADGRDAFVGWFTDASARWHALVVSRDPADGQVQCLTTADEHWPNWMPPKNELLAV